MYIPEPDTKLVFVMKTRTESRQVKNIFRNEFVKKEIGK